MPDGSGTIDDVLETSQVLAMAPFDRERPLWEAVLIEGLPRRPRAYALKLHHSLLDGAAGIQLFDILHSETPERRTEKPTRAARRCPRRARRDGVARRSAARVRGDDRPRRRRARDVGADLLAASRADDQLRDAVRALAAAARRPAAGRALAADGAPQPVAPPRP